MKIYTNQQKEMAIARAKRFGVRVAAAQLKIPVETLDSWMSGEKPETSGNINHIKGEKTMAKKNYTAEEKAAILKRAEETNMVTAAKEFGVNRVTIAAWKKAGELETAAKKTSRKVKADVKAAEEKAAEVKEEVKKTTRKTRKAAEEKAAEVKEEVKKTEAKAKRGAAKAKKDLDKQAADLEEKAFIEEIETKKAAAKAKRVVTDAAKIAKEEAKKAAVPKPKMFRTAYVLQSAFGHELLVEDIEAKIPENVEKVYIRMDQNLLHWVDKDGNTGSVPIW